MLERFIPLSKYRPVLFASLIGVGAILAAFASVNSVFLAAAGLFLLDFCWVGLFIYSGTLSQYVTDDQHLARVDSIGDLVFLAASSVSSLLAGLLIKDGHVATYLIVLALTVLPALLTLAFVKADTRGSSL